MLEADVDRRRLHMARSAIHVHLRRTMAGAGEHHGVVALAQHRLVPGSEKGSMGRVVRL